MIQKAGGTAMNPNDGLHALDAVRAYALPLGIILHASAAFVE